MSRNVKHMHINSRLQRLVRSRTAMVPALLFVILAVASIAAVVSSEASTGSGSVSPASPTKTFTGGPFTMNNPSAPTTDVDPQCVDPLLPCHVYTLNVSVPAGSSYDVSVSVGWVNTGGTPSDFDVFAYKPDGSRAGVAASSMNPEEVRFPAAAGAYTIKVVPYDVQPNVTFTGTVQLIPAGGGGGGGVTPTPTPTPATVPGAPRFQTYLSPAGTGDDFGEPSIGANWLSGNTMFYGGSSADALRVSFDDCPSPAKATWTKTPLITAGTTRALGDPILYTDHLTGRTIVSQLEGGTKQSTSDYTDNDGASYTPTQGSGINSGVDHQTVGGGPFAPGSLGHTYPNAVYYCAQDVADANCAQSLDGGVTFGPAIPIYTINDCGGLHGHVKVAPDGTVYVPNRSCTGTQGVAVSTNNGLTWTVRKVTGTGTNSSDPSVAFDATNKAYLGYGDGNNHPKVKVSTDRGVTWSAGTDLGASLGVIQTAFPAAVAGDAGRAAVAFLGSTASGNPNDAPSFRGIWHLYISTTFDGGQTWTTTDATPNDPVQVGSLCQSGTTCGDDRNLLDFMDATVDKLGRVMVGYADGCVAPACTTATAAGNPPYSASRSAKAVIARQSGGKRMFAQYDPQEPLVPAAPRVDSVTRNGSSAVHLEWSEPDNGGSALFGYNVYRRTAAGVYGVPLNGVNPLTKTTFDDTTADLTTTYFYKVTAVNAIGQSTNCGEFSPSTQAAADPCTRPGVLVVNDTADAAPNVPADSRLDYKKLFVAEPFFGAGVNNLVFTMQMAPSSLTTAPPSSQWYLIWNRLTPDTNFDRYYVAMVSDATGNVTYEYGKFGVPLVATSPNPNANTPVKLGAADAGSYDPLTGEITITLSTSKAESIQPGQALSGINGRTFLSQPATGVKSQRTASDITDEGTYQLRGNAACQPNAAPVASLVATPRSGSAPLNVNFDASGSTDPDAADTIASYSFDFGDGSAPVTQAAPTVAHTYTTAGEYFARVTVTDSRGKASATAAQAVINVSNAGCNANVALASNGSTAVASSTYTSRNYQPQYAIDGSSSGLNWETGGGWNDETRDVYPDWLEVDFNGAKRLNEIRVYTLQDNYKQPQVPDETLTCGLYGLLDYDVQYWNGSAWVTVPGGNVTANDKVLRKFPFAEVTTTKIRVFVTNARAHFSRIVEVEAYGCNQ